MLKEKTSARPFVKWAGGKGQLIEEYRKYYPDELKNGRIKRYMEPLIGGGAIFFDIINNYEIEEFYINDINKDLILTYRVIKENVQDLIKTLGKLDNTFKSTPEEDKSELYYGIRTSYNKQAKEINYEKYNPKWINRAANLIFLNRTCFNGLFRVNLKGEFNVPFGKYKNPKICDAENLLTINKVLQKVNILSVDYTKLEQYVDENTLVYFDPPYRPISESSAFTSYSKFDFNDNEQERLASFYKTLDKAGAKLMLSNSDPKNLDESDTFFDELYEGFNIVNVKATRMINSRVERRGAVKELLILNYCPNGG